MSQPRSRKLKGISGSTSAATAHQSFIRIEDTGGPKFENMQESPQKVLSNFRAPCATSWFQSSSAVECRGVELQPRLLVGAKIRENEIHFFLAAPPRWSFTLSANRGSRKCTPGSTKLRVEMLNQTMATTARQAQIDSFRASDIAKQFASVEYDVKEDRECSEPLPRPTNRASESVINMLVVEAEEQVMLKVNVAEVQRTALEQRVRSWCGAAVAALHDAAENKLIPADACTGAERLFPSFGIGTAASAAACAVGHAVGLGTGLGFEDRQ